MLEIEGICCSVKESVQQKYDAIASDQLDSGFCMVESMDYKCQPGYQSGADVGLGCGTPVAHADLLPGEMVLDLGSGAGLDALIASPFVGEKGRVFGVDLAPSMVERAKKNVLDAGVKNVFFQEGDIEQLPFEDSSFDVVISNCTLNLVPDKEAAYFEIARVLRSGGRFIISDVVIDGNPDPVLVQKAEEVAGCVAGAAQKNAYLQLISAAGFADMKILHSHRLKVIDEYDGLESITIRAFQP